MVKEFVRNDAAQQSPEDTGYLHVCHDAGSAHDVIALLRGQIDNAPAFDGIAGNIDTERGQAEDPDGRILDDSVPLHGTDVFFLFFVDLFLCLFPIVDSPIRQALRFRAVTHAKVDEDRTDQGNDAGRNESHRPVIHGDDGSNGKVSERRAEIVAREPDAI